MLPLSLILSRAGYAAADVGLVWIDVNGTEADVLAGMAGLLEARVPVVLEHLPQLISADAARGIHTLLSLYYTSFARIDLAGALPQPLSEMNPLRDSGDFLFF